MAERSKTAKQRLRNLAGRLAGSTEDAPFELAGHRFSQLRLLEKKPGRMWSRAGRISWSATMDERPVKICECASPEHAAFITQLSRHDGIGAHFPAVHLQQGALIVVDWIEGEELTWQSAFRDSALLEAIVGLQVRFHATAMEVPGAASGFDYRDFLLRRAWRFKSILPIDDALAHLERATESGGTRRAAKISHPDLSAANLVRERGSGRLVSIDNELVTHSAYFSIDLFNTARTFGGDANPESLGRYLDTYVAAGGDLGPLREDPEFFEALSVLRVLGTALQNGDLAGAAAIAEDVLDADRPSPPLLAMAQQRSA